MLPPLRHCPEILERLEHVQRGGAARADEEVQEKANVRPYAPDCVFPTDVGRYIKSVSEKEGEA